MIATLNLSLNVTDENCDAVLDGVRTLLKTGAVFATVMTEPEAEAPAAAANDAAPKAKRRKAAEAAPAAEEAPAAAEEPTATDAPQPEVTEPEPAAPPPADELTMEVMTDRLNTFAKAHGVAATRKTIQGFGITRLSELDKARWPELLAKLQAENGGKPV